MDITKKSVKHDAFFAFYKIPEQIQAVLTEFRYCLPELNFSEEYRHMMAEKFSKHAVFLVYENSFDKIGFVAFYANDYESKIAYISFIAVAEQYRRKKIGQLLLIKVCDIAKERGMKSIKIEVYKSNINARHFYCNNGFEELCEASAKSIYMVKRLGDIDE